jgi:hypothetical protein
VPTFFVLLGLLSTLNAWTDIRAAYDIIGHWHYKQSELLSSEPVMGMAYDESPLFCERESTHKGYRKALLFCVRTPWIFAIFWIMLGFWSVLIQLTKAVRLAAKTLRNWSWQRTIHKLFADSQQVALRLGAFSISLCFSFSKALPGHCAFGVALKHAISVRLQPIRFEEKSGIACQVVIAVWDRKLHHVLVHVETASVQSTFVVSLHLTSVTPNRSAMGLLKTLRGAFPGLGIGARSASQHAQCHASAFRIFGERMTKDFGFP